MSTHALLLSLSLCLAGCGAPHSTALASSNRGVAAAQVANDIERKEYAGSAACQPCHAAIAATWSRSPMHRMTRTAAAAAVEAPFDGTSFRFKDDVAVLEARGGDRFLRLDSARLGRQLYRVTLVIGGRVREDFAGIRVSDYLDAGTGGEELVLPVSYLRASHSLRYKGYSVLVHERPGLEAGPSYSRTCIFCHNTAPYLSSLYGALAPKRMPPYQGEVVDRMLPDASRWVYVARDDGGLRRAIGDEMSFLGAAAADGDSPLRHAVDATRERFGRSQLVEVGIGCESCHGGSREHARDPLLRPSYAPTAPWLALAPATGRAPTRAEQINHVCARCHQVLFSRYPWTWEGGSRAANAGGSNINSGEGRDFLLGGCASAMSCTRCHDPHADRRSGAVVELETPAGNDLCLGCHGALRGEAAQRGHSHHAPDGNAGPCIACHMPRKNMSLDGRLMRYHRIGSPTDPLRVLGDRPLECALCHADKSVGEIVTTMERWWNKSYDRDALRRLYGNLDIRPMVATLERGKPHEQAVASFVLGQSRERGAAPAIARVLASPLPLVRQYARDALQLALGKPCPVVLEGELHAIEAQADACLAAAGLPAVVWPAIVRSPEPPSESPED